MNSMLRSFAVLAALCCTPAWAEVETWYAYWGIGTADHGYPAQLEQAFREADAQPGVDRTEMSLDVLGFYWPLASKKTILGFVVSGSFDALDDGYTSVQLNQYLYSFSTMRFAGDEPGKGFFVRGDLGLAKAVMTSSYGGDVASDTGYGYLAGAGYGFAVSEKTRILLSATYSNKDIEGDSFSTFGFNIGGLW